MTYEKKDTTGIVAATISNDFKTISRTQYRREINLQQSILLVFV
jgi:hypothetical protein